ncbi:serine protein kinase [Ustulina deusta]|nr:serine protein kinase [Ustulina deusta]
MSTSVSPPPTPPSRPPSRGESRFEIITSPCEWVEKYRPGGYHPVHLGHYSTVWLARDRKEERYVALKILVSDLSGLTDETRMLHHLSQVAPVQAARHLTKLLDSFEHPGPNGLHKCLVFEPMGPNVHAMAAELPLFKVRKLGMEIRYPPQTARSILKQSLQALVFLHENGIAHGDFQPGNMLFALDNIDSKAENLLQQEQSAQANSISPPVLRRDGKQDRWAPRYLCIAQPLAAFTNYTNDLKIKVSDMGGAYFFTDPPIKPIILAGFRAPEFILTGAVNDTFDVWSFGCLLFELMTGRRLFCALWFGSQVTQDDDHLVDMTMYLGPLPEELYKHWKTSSLYFTPQREFYNCLIEGVADEKEPIIPQPTSMEKLFDEAYPDLNENEADQVKSLIRRILQYDPANRPSATEILQDPWFCKA